MMNFLQNFFIFQVFDPHHILMKKSKRNTYVTVYKIRLQPVKDLVHFTYFNMAHIGKTALFVRKTAIMFVIFYRSFFLL